jgi:hypothetical protein
MLRAASSKHAGQLRLSGLIDQIQRRLVVPSNPVDVRATLEQVLGRVQPTALAGTPERLSDHLRTWFWPLAEKGLNSIQQAKCSRIAQPSVRASLDEPLCRCPVTESAGIRQWTTAAEHRPRRLHVGSRIEQRIKYGDVIAACGPVQRCLGVEAVPAVGIHIGASRDQTFHNCRAVGEMPWPVCRSVQQRPIALVIAKAGSCKPWMHCEQALKGFKITSLYGLRGCHHTRIVGGNDANRALHVWLARHGCQGISVA